MSKNREYKLHRTDYTKKSTVGAISLDGKHICYALEDTVRKPGEKKVFGETAIPAGRYQIVITKSERFSKLKGKDVFLPLLVGVPGFAGIRIHTGNRPEDSEGCLLVGSSKSADWVAGSKDAFAILYPMVEKQLAAGDKVYITIE
jgi:Family of unknown function (DUF5675)